ncbi:hypothetical protein GCM10023221_35650 [Luteimicrobium xylanilyticum]
MTHGGEGSKPTRRPHRRQEFIRDPLANPEALEARAQGLYDPRKVSGRRIRVLVRFHCVRCSARLGELVQFEQRDLWHSLREEQWTQEPSGLKCQKCYGPFEPFGVDLDAIAKRAEAARTDGRARSLGLGDMPESLGRGPSH